MGSLAGPRFIVLADRCSGRAPLVVATCSGPGVDVPGPVQAIVLTGALLLPTEEGLGLNLVRRGDVSRRLTGEHRRSACLFNPVPRTSAMRHSVTGSAGRRATAAICVRPEGANVLSTGGISSAAGAAPPARCARLGVRRARTIMLAVVIALGCLAAPAVASALTVNFDDLTPGTSVTAYPSPNPVIGFGDPSSYGFQTGAPADGTVYSLACGPLYVQADPGTHSSPNMGNFQGCQPLEGGTFPERGSFAALTYGADSVSADVGSPDTTDRFELDAYDQDRHFLGSSTITASAAGPNNVIEYSTPGVYDIAYFAIYERSVQFEDPSTLIGIDDLSIDTCTPDVNCSPGIALPTSTVGGSLAVSAAAQYQVHLIREDGSSGPVALSVAGLGAGAGLSATFSPSTLTGTETTSTLTVAASASATIANWNGALTATPMSAEAGTTTASEPLALNVVAPFQVGAGPGNGFSDTPLPSRTTLSVEPCSSASTDVRTSVGPLYTGTPIALGLGYGGDNASAPAQNITLQDTHLTNPSGFDPSGYDDQQLTVHRDSAPTENDTFTITITPTGPPNLTGSAASIMVTNAPPTISKVSYTNSSPLVNGTLNSYGTPGLGLNPQDFALTPQALAQGAQVQIQGSGFCPGTVVEFGNSDAAAAATVNSTGTELTTNVPALATTGPLTVRSGGANTPGMTATAPPSALPGSDPSAGLRIDSYRNTRGFQFQNFTPSIQDQDMQNAFGFGAVYDSVDTCVIGCTVSFFDPLAKVLEWIAQDTIGSTSSGGACFGFSLGSYEMIGSIPGPAYYFSVNPDVYPLTEDEQIPDYGYTVHDFITAAALKQLSSEFLQPLLERFAAQNEQGSSAASVSVYNEIKSILSKGRPAMISLLDGSGGHSVDAYQLEGSPPNYYIDVYDSNQPFSATEDADPTGHREDFAVSRVHVTGGSWRLDSPVGTTSPLQGQIADFGVDLSNFSSHDSGLLVTDPATIPFNPTPLSKPGALAGTVLSGAVDFIFGGDASTASVKNDASSIITQVSDGAGHTLFGHNGELNANPQSRLLGAPVATLTSTSSGSPSTRARAPLSFIVPGSVSTLKATVHDTGSGPDAHTIVRPGQVSVVGTRAQPGAEDHFEVGPAGESFTTSAGHKPLTLTMLDASGTGSAKVTRTVRLTTTSFRNGGDAIALLDGGRVLGLTHRGPATTASLTMSAAGAGSPPETFSTSPIPIPANATERVTGIAWAALQNSTVRISGHGRSIRVRNAHTVPRLANIAAVHAHKLLGDKAALTIVTRRRRLPVGATRAFVWVVRRGGRVVARHTAVEATGTRSATFSFGTNSRGRYKLTAKVVVITSGVAGSTATTTRTLAFRA
jgi:hypothetical protein